MNCDCQENVLGAADSVSIHGDAFFCHPRIAAYSSSLLISCRHLSTRKHVLVGDMDWYLDVYRKGPVVSDSNVFSSGAHETQLNRVMISVCA